MRRALTRRKKDCGHLAAAMLSVGLLAFACTDKGTEPTPVRSRIYVMVQGRPQMIFVIDADADTLVDSLVLPLDWGNAPVTCDPYAPRFAATYGNDVLLFRGGEQAPYQSATIPSVYLGLDGHRGVLVGSQGSHGGVIAPRFDIYRLDDLTVLHTDTVPLTTRLRLDHTRGVAYGISRWEETPGGPNYRNELCAYDYVNRRLHGCWNINPDSNGVGYVIFRFAIHPDGRRAYLTTVRFWGGIRFVGYDLAENRTVFDLPLYGPGGEPEVAPDGETVWYPDPGIGLRTDPETITIYDARTGAVRGVIFLGAYRHNPIVPLAPYQIRFAPAGDKAYVLCGQIDDPVLVIDVRTLEVIKMFFPDDGSPLTFREPSSMDIGPAP